MSYLPQSNGTIVQLLPPSVAEDWDKSATEGTPLWTGESECYIVQQQRTIYDPSAGAMRYISTVTCYAPLDWAGPLNIANGQFLVFTTGGSGENQVHRIMSLNYPVLAEEGPLAGLFGQPVTIQLDPTPVEVNVPID